MIDSTLLITGILMFSATIVGIVVGSWLNSKLLTRTWKGEIENILNHSKKGTEYKTLIELLNNLNEALKSPEARYFFQNANQLLNEIRQQLIQPPPKKTIILPTKNTPHPAEQK